MYVYVSLSLSLYIYIYTHAIHTFTIHSFPSLSLSGLRQHGGQQPDDGRHAQEQRHEVGCRPPARITLYYSIL